MITKEQLLQSVEEETKIIKHLVSKLTSEQLEYRPVETMRSTIELLRYTTICGVSPVKCLVNNNWEIAAAYGEQSASLSLEEIPAALDKQLAEIKEVVSGLSDDQLRNSTVKYPWGAEDKLGSALINCTLKFLTAYKLQLFTYAKASGLSELSTYNAWIGIDKPAG